MSKKIFKIDNRFIFVHLNWADTKPRGWYTKDKSENKTYMLFAINHERCGKDEKLWAVSFVLGPIHFIVGSPYLIKKYQKED